MADLIKILIALGVFINIVPLMVIIERRVSAKIQKRMGPNRVGPFGILQPLADAIKLITKEDLTPGHVNKWVYRLAPAVVMLPGALAFAVIPFGSQMAVGGKVINLQIADLNVGLLFVLAITSMGVYGISFGGWASNNKYSLFGGVRSTAQLVSYEVAMSIALVAALMTTGTINLQEIVRGQTGSMLGGWLPAWNVFKQPIAAGIFFIAMFAETNRLPFDLAECEAELIGGYLTEYGSMKFGLYMMGEFLAMVTMSGLMVTVFLGGWHFPGIDPTSTSVAVGLLTCLIFLTKVMTLMFIFVWVRWSLPRFRYDQLMNLGWKVLIPIGLANIALTGILGTI